MMRAGEIANIMTGGRGVAGPIMAALALLSAGTAHAQSREMAMAWRIEPAPLPPPRALSSGEFVLKQRLLPLGLAELGAPLLGVAGAELPAGAQLVEAISPGVKIFCPPRVAKQKLIGLAHVCLVDGDSDGRFEAYFKTQSQTKGLLTIGGSRPKNPKPMTPIAYTRVDPMKLRDDYFVGIERRNYFNIYSLETFTVAFGREGEIERITTPIKVKTGELPKPLTVLGARFTAVSEQDGKMQVTVEAAMPPQVFGVTKTVSYRFY